MQPNQPRRRADRLRQEMEQEAQQELQLQSQPPPAPQPEPPPQPPARKRRLSARTIVLIVLAAAIVAAAAIGAALWLNTRDPGYERYEFDSDAMAGRIQQMTPEEIQAELNRVVDEGMFNISIASTVVFEGPEGEGEIRIENIAANHYHMQVDLFLDETGEKIYASKLIQPGYSIETIQLNRRLEPGEYDATAVFSAITQQEKQLFGQAAAQIKLYVLDQRPTPTPSPSPAPAAQD